MRRELKAHHTTSNRFAAPMPLVETGILARIHALTGYFTPKTAPWVLISPATGFAEGMRAVETITASFMRAFLIMKAMFRD